MTATQLSWKWYSPGISVHAVIMIAMWAYLLPAMAVYARYFSPSPLGIWIHAAVQMLISLTVLGSFAIVIFNNDVPSLLMQKVSGYPVLALLLVQMALGMYLLYARFGHADPTSDLMQKRRQARTAHAAVALAVITLAMLNIPQGANVMVNTDMLHPLWFSWYLPLLFWLITVPYLEWRRRAELDRYKPVGQQGGVSAAENGGGGMSMAQFQGQQQQQGGKPYNPAAAMAAHAAAALQQQARDQQLPTVTWREMGDAVQTGGKMWVAGPGGVVFDVAQWITSHPGGQQVLYDAIGTSVLIDFFSLATFDRDLMQSINPVPELPPLPAPDSTMYPAAAAAATAAVGGRPASPTTSDVAAASGNLIMATNQGAAMLRLTSDEWAAVVSARMTNVHSPQAVGKLGSMAVARLASPAASTLFRSATEVADGTSGSSSSSAGPMSEYDAHEYRRYAVIGKERLSPPSSTVATYKLSVCLLFPHNTHAQEPLFLLPGHVVELRLRISRATVRQLATRGYRTNDIPTSGLVSRYYTPLNGNLTKLDLAIKCVPGGVMSHLVSLLEIGKGQVQLRGPFGSPLCNPHRPLPLQVGCWDHIVMLSAGSGLVPALQLANWMYLPRMRHVTALQNARGASGSPGDPGVTVADPVSILHELGNGWIHGHNRRARADTVVPLGVLMPWVGTAPKLTVIAGEADLGSLMGTPTFAMAAQAYPSQVSLHYRVKQPNSTVDPAATAANVTYGRMDADYVTSLLAPLAGRPDTMVVICGPQRFIDEAYGWACGIIGEDRVQILPPSTPLTNPEQTLVVPKGSGLPVAVHRDLQTGLGNWLYFKPRRA